MLELGCGDGGNLLGMAVALPDSRFVGIDAAARAVERGRARAAALGLSNLELHTGDIARLPDDLGEFDYVVAHGVLSWVPPPVRDALLAACRRHLAPDGIAYVSYNAYPGGHLRAMSREILRYHVRDIDEREPERRLRAAQQLMRLVVATDDGSPYSRALREEFERVLAHSDPLMLHDDLAEHAQPFYFHELMAMAGAHGLRFLGEADVTESQLPDLPDDLAAQLEALGDDVLLREQYIDFVRNRPFRRTLLCRAEHAEAGGALHAETVPTFAVASAARLVAGADGLPDRFVGPSGGVDAVHPVVRPAMSALEAAWPRALPYAEVEDAVRWALGRATPGDSSVLLELVLGGYLAGMIELHAWTPPVAERAGPRPLASPLARLQAEAGEPVLTSLRHESVHLADEPLALAVLPLLDGTRDRADLAAELGGDDGLDAALDRLARAGLLSA